MSASITSSSSSNGNRQDGGVDTHSNMMSANSNHDVIMTETFTDKEFNLPALENNNSNNNLKYVISNINRIVNQNHIDTPNTVIATVTQLQQLGLSDEVIQKYLITKSTTATTTRTTGTISNDNNNNDIGNTDMNIYESVYKLPLEPLGVYHQSTDHTNTETMIDYHSTNTNTNTNTNTPLTNNHNNNNNNNNISPSKLSVTATLLEKIQKRLNSNDHYLQQIINKQLATRDNNNINSIENIQKSLDKSTIMTPATTTATATTATAFTQPRNISSITIIELLNIIPLPIDTQTIDMLQSYSYRLPGSVIFTADTAVSVSDTIFIQTNQLLLSISETCQFSLFKDYIITNDSGSGSCSNDNENTKSIKILKTFEIHNLFTTSLLKLYFDMQHIQFLLQHEPFIRYISNINKNSLKPLLRQYEKLVLQLKISSSVSTSTSTSTTTTNNNNEWKKSTNYILQHVYDPDFTFTLPYQQQYNFFNRLSILHTTATNYTTANSDTTANNNNNKNNSNINQLMYEKAMYALYDAVSHLHTDNNNSEHQQLSSSAIVNINDYIVIDNILQPSYLTSLMDRLYFSTIHNDVTSGGYFAAYNNDGLVQSEFQILVQILTYFCHNNNNNSNKNHIHVSLQKSYMIEKYFTMTTYTLFNLYKMSTIGKSDNIPTGKRIFSPILQGS